MDSGTLDKECHRDDEPHAHEKDCVPVGLKQTDDLKSHRQLVNTYRHPLFHCQKRFLVEE